MSTRAPWRCREAAAALVVTLAVASPGRCAGEPVDAAPEALVVGISLNGLAVADGQIVHRATAPGDRRVWLERERATAWRIDPAGRPSRAIGGVEHLELCIGDDRCVLDAEAAMLSIELRPDRFLPLHVGLPTDAAESAAGGSAISSGGFVNYDLGTWKHGRRPGFSALASGRLYTPHGQGAVDVVALHAGGVGSRALARAVWQVDDAPRNRSVQIGSIAIPDTSLGAGLPLTGVRVGSNRLLNPTLPPVLRPMVDGVIDRSTRTDVFVDGQYRQTALVPYGPYRIELLPQLAGRGDIELVSTAADGTRTRALIPYYQAPSMLAPGRSEWSVDAGRVASGAGRGSRLGHPWLANGWWRRGLSTSHTGEGQLVLGERAARAAASLDTVHPRWGATTLGAVWQRSPSVGNGRLWLGGGHEFVSRDASFSVRTEQPVGGCRPATAESPADGLARPCRYTTATVGGTVFARGSIAATAERLQDADGHRRRLAAVSARWQLGPLSQVALTVQRAAAVESRAATAVSLVYSRALGEATSLQTSLQRSDRETELQWVVQPSAVVDETASALRWQAVGSVGRGGGGDSGGRGGEVGARWSRDEDRFSWRTEAGIDRRGTAGAAGIGGAVGFAEGRFFASRRIDDAFIVVDAGLPGLPVLVDNRPVAVTDGSGRAIVPNARARQENTIGVDVAALPLPYAMPRDQLTVVPGVGSGALARFDLSDGGLAIAVRDREGGALPAGAAVRVSNQTVPTAVTSASTVFIDRADRPATLTIEWPGRRCRIDYVPQIVPADGYRCAR